MPPAPLPRTMPLQPAHAATQERSRRTLERILDAAAGLLDDRDFDALTMVDLAREAGCGVGTLYGRIPNKDSLLVCLHERFIGAGIDSSADLFEACRDAGLSQRVRVLSELIVEFLSRRRGVNRAITEYLYSRPNSDVGGFRRRATAAYRQMAVFLAEKVDHALHPDAERACLFVLLAAVEVAQSRLVFGERSAVSTRFSKRELRERMATMMLTYLGGKLSDTEPQPPRSPR